MKIILRQDTDDMGLEGDIAEVANGYARNYLIPRGIALEASKQNVKLFEMQKKKIEVKRLKAIDEAEKVKEMMADMSVVISQKVGEEEKLYGSVTSMDIAAQLEKQGMTVDRRRIMLDRPIKTLGEFEVPVKLYADVISSIKVIVKPEAIEE